LKKNKAGERRKKRFFLFPFSLKKEFVVFFFFAFAFAFLFFSRKKKQK